MSYFFLAGIDVDAIEENLQSELEECGVLQDTLLGLAFCDPLEEFMEIVAKVPPELLKVFRISQLTIRYLLKSQEMLTVSIQNLNNNNEITHKVCFLKICKYLGIYYLFYWISYIYTSK